MVHKTVGVVLLSLFVSPPAFAQDLPARFSLGYAYAEYLPENGGAAPFGLYFSVASMSNVGVEGELAYHRDLHESYTLDTLTLFLGPRFAAVSGEVQPYGHILGGFRFDAVANASNAAVGLAVGGGVDVRFGTRAFLRIGADFQIYFNEGKKLFDEGENPFDEGENLKVLRLLAGFVY